MTREEAIVDIRDNIKPVVGGKSLDLAIKALEQEPCEDAISRQAVLNIIDFEDKWLLDAKSHNEDTKMAFWTIKSKISDLKSVKPQPKMGQWEWVRYDGLMGNWHCSECRTIIPHMPEETDDTPCYKWCPMCGARMEEGNELL